MAFDPTTEKVETFKPAKPMMKRHRGMWWEGLVHPLTDDGFVTAFCEHVFKTTTDRSLVTVRNRAHRFIRTFMAADLESQLTKYREDYS